MADFPNHSGGVIQVTHAGRWGAVPEALLEDKRLSLDTRAVAAWLSIKANGWQICISALRRANGEGGKPLGEHKWLRIARELEDAGYFSRQRKKGEKGQWLWCITFTPLPTIPGFSGHGSAMHEKSRFNKEPDKPLQEIQPSPPSHKPSDDDELFEQPSLKEQPVEFKKTSKKLSTDKNEGAESKVVRIDGKSVPKELAWLVLKRGLSLTRLFALMKRARAKGKLLSDVVECVAQHLSKLEDGKAIFAYLNKLVTLERDFAWEVRQKREKANIGKQKLDEGQRLAKAQEKLFGLWFVSRQSGAIFEVERGGWVRVMSFDTSGRVREGCEPLDIAFVDAVEAGLLASCQAGSTPIVRESEE